MFAVFLVSWCLGGSIAGSAATQSHSVHLWMRIGHPGRFGDLAVGTVAGSGDPAATGAVGTAAGSGDPATAGAVGTVAGSGDPATAG